MLALKLLGIFYASALLAILALLLYRRDGLPEGSSVGLALLGFIAGALGVGLYLALGRPF